MSFLIPFLTLFTNMWFVCFVRCFSGSWTLKYIITFSNGSLAPVWTSDVCNQLQHRMRKRVVVSWLKVTDRQFTQYGRRNSWCERETETHREKLRDKYGFSEKNNHCSSLLETLSYLVVFVQGLGVYKAPCTCWWITSFVSVLHKWDNRLRYGSSGVMETEQIYALRPCATCFPGYQDYVYWMGCRQSVMERNEGPV